MTNGPGQARDRSHGDAGPVAWRPDRGADRYGRELSPYPDGREFAFSVVHDADSAYSRRLAPLFEVFDALGMRLTVTVFPFWAEWAKGGRIWANWRAAPAGRRLFKPVAVPLEDPDERRFYLDLAARGHDIAIHTPSETSSRRDQVRRAFDYYAEVFGAPARMYVEHSAGSKLDAMAQQGADPDSAYYNLDLLRDAGCWVWLDHGPSLLQPQSACPNLLGRPGAPWDLAARREHGLTRAFMRNGAGSDGAGFLRHYGPAALDELACRRGLVLLYTHLDAGWLDPETLAMQAQIRANLEYLTGLNGWFATAGDILDRFEAMTDVHWCGSTGEVTLVNHGIRPIDGLTLWLGLARSPSATAGASSGGDPLVIDRLGVGERRVIGLPASRRE